MNAILTRSSANLYGVFGQLVLSDGTKYVTLEHAFPNGGTPVGFEPAVPVGTYTCQRRLSPKFGFDVFELLNVPGHSYIEIHIGNYNKDTDGCILLGERLGTGCILKSEVDFKDFMERMKGVDTFQLTVQ